MHTRVEESGECKSVSQGTSQRWVDCAMAWPPVPKSHYCSWTPLWGGLILYDTWRGWGLVMNNLYYDKLICNKHTFTEKLSQKTQYLRNHCDMPQTSKQLVQYHRKALERAMLPSPRHLVLKTVLIYARRWSKSCYFFGKLGCCAAVSGIRV